VISIQAGSYEPFAIDAPEINHYPNSLYGKFTINLGIYIDELHVFHNNPKAKDFVREAECHIRTRISHLANSTDKWYSIDSNHDELSKNTIELIEKYGLPFLERFESRQKIEEYFKTEERIYAPVPLVFLSIMRHHAGDSKGASFYIKKHINAIVNHEGHKESVINLAKKVGIEI
jgi:hypothetical protein